LKLQVAVTDLPQCRKDLTIEVAADEVRSEFEKAYEAYTRYAKVPGFRLGRVPRGVIKQRFAKEVTDQVVGNLLPPALEHVLNEHKLNIIGKPHLDDISVSEGEPLRFKVALEILPEFELREYKGLKATKRIARITDEDVERVLEHFRDSAAEFVPIEDRPSQDGDFISVNFAGKYIEPQEEEDLKADNVQIELGSAGTMAEFNEHLRGVRADDVREFRVNYPENFASQGLAGKTLDFTATVVAVRRKELPELDDDFARDFGEYENLQQVRDRIREDLTANAEIHSGNGLRDDLLEELLSAYDFDVPFTMVEQRAAERTREYAYLLLRSGVSPQTVNELNWEAQISQFRKQAIHDVRAALVLARIGQAENIRIAEEEVDAEVERMAAINGEPPALLKARLTKDDALSSIENTLRYQKALGIVLSHAEITIEESTEDRKTEQAQSEAAGEGESRSAEQV